MTRNITKTIVAIGALAASVMTADAKTLRWAWQGDLQSLDPMALNETFTMGTQDWFYESLMYFDKDLNLIPRLATKWEQVEPTKWVFNLRKDVKFHDGTPFTAKDVVFSWKRSLSRGSDMRSFGLYVSNVREIDDHTVEMTTPNPDPVLPREWIDMRIMSKDWAERHGAVEASGVKDSANNYANMHENGTGPFTVVDRQPDVKTVFKRFDGYWDKNIKTNVTDIIFQPITQEATRLAALISGEIDLILPVPLQDWGRLKEYSNITVRNRPETRPIIFGMDQSRDELLFSDVKGKNPFKDIRVREALVRAVDVDAINKKLMQGAARPTGTLIASSIAGFDPSFGNPYEVDLKKAASLMKEAGYADGFKVQMDCPNDRYVNDEKICQAVASMLSRINIKVDLLAQTKSKFFAKTQTQAGNKTSLFMQGFSPSSVDAGRVLDSVIYCRDVEKGEGLQNWGGYCNKKVDALIQAIRVETDQTKRNAMIREAFTLVRQDYGFIPIHDQPLSWATKKGIVAEQRADGVLDIRDVVVP